MKNILFLTFIVLLCKINYINCLNENSTITTTSQPLESFTKDSFNSLKVIKNCEFDSNCPRYGKCIYDTSKRKGDRTLTQFGYCKFMFLCHEKGECLSLYSRCANDDECENGVCEFGICRNSLITKTCNEKSVNDNKCEADSSMEKCNSNSDCFSNICKNGVCISNSENKIYRCGTVVDDNRDDAEIICKLNQEEECDSDGDCFSDNCSKGKCEAEKNYTLSTILTIIAVFAVLILCFGCSCLSSCFSPCFSSCKKDNHGNNGNSENNGNYGNVN